MNAFRFQRFAASREDERARLCEELARVLSQRLSDSPDFASEATAIVAALRELGHELYSFDEDDDFQIWCPDYTRARPGLNIELRVPADAVVSWTPGESDT